MTGYRKRQDDSGWLISARLKRRLIVASSILLGVVVDAIVSPVVQDLVQWAMPSNSPLSVLWHIITIGVSATIIWAILRKLFGW